MVEIKLNKRYKYAGDIMPKLLEVGFDLETACDFLNSIKDSDVVPKSAWISVDERLPEPFVSVLTYMPGEAPHPTVHEGYLNKRGKWYAGGCDRLPDEVVMWMPMPEPPITDKPTQE